jgi:hypothetical protein
MRPERFRFAERNKDKFRILAGRTHSRQVATSRSVGPPTLCLRLDRGSSVANDGISLYGCIRPMVRGKGMVSRTCLRPQIQVTQRSTPSPNPPCGMEPYRRRSRYQS